MGRSYQFVPLVSSPLRYSFAMLLNLDEAPKDPIERLLYLSGVKEQVAVELEVALSAAYFQARLERRFDAALAAGPYALKRALALTRHENQKRGRSIRWNDGLDSTSSAYGKRPEVITKQRVHRG